MDEMRGLGWAYRRIENSGHAHMFWALGAAFRCCCDSFFIDREMQAG